MDSIRLRRIGKIAEYGPGRLGVGQNHIRNRLLGQPEHRDGALVSGALALPVAASRRLQDRIQPGFFPPDSGEIQIYTRFDQRSGYYPAGRTCLQPGADLRQQTLAVDRAQQGGQAIAALLGQHSEQSLGGGPAIDNAQCLVNGRKLPGQIFLGDFARLPQGGPAEKGIQPGGVLHDFP